MNVMRQRTRNDCAYTCLVMLLREDWTLLKTKVPVLRDFRRSVFMHTNRRPITVKNQHEKRRRFHPYGHLMGLDQREIMFTLLQCLKNFEKVPACRMDALDKNETYLITVQSINYHNCLHCIVMHNGRIWDPSNKKRYVYRPHTKILGALKVSDLEIYDMNTSEATKFVSQEINLVWKAVDCVELRE